MERELPSVRGPRRPIPGAPASAMVPDGFSAILVSRTKTFPTESASQFSRRPKPFAADETPRVTLLLTLFGELRRRSRITYATLGAAPALTPALFSLCVLCLWLKERSSKLALVPVSTSFTMIRGESIKSMPSNPA